MRVLLVEPCWENFGGYFRAINIAKNIAKKGIDITVIIPQVKGISKNSTKREYFLVIKKVKNKSHSITDRLYRFLFVAYDIIKNKYDVIHIFTIVHPEMILVLFFCKMLRKKIILDWDDYWQDSPLYRAGGKIIRAYIKIAENYVGRFVTHMTVTSDFLRDKAMVLGTKKILKIINGVDVEQFKVCSCKEAIKQLKYNRGNKYLLSFGNSYEQERALLLLKTFEKVSKKNGSVKLITNINFKELLRCQNKLMEFDKKLFDSIIVTGFIPPKDLGLYLAVSECVIFLTDNSDAEKACFPIRIGSYLNGEKVIATNDTNTEWCNNMKRFNCALIGDNPKNLASKITFFLTDKNVQEKMKNNVKIAKEVLSWENIIIKLVDFYKTK